MPGRDLLNLMPAPTVGAGQRLEKLVSSFLVPWGPWSPTFLAPGTRFVEDSFFQGCGECGLEDGLGLGLGLGFRQ